MNNSVDSYKPQKTRFSVAIQTQQYQNLINSTLSDPGRARSFVASITSAVAVNPLLQDCDASTILAGALLGESLNLSPSPQLGQYYLVPFNVKENGRKVKKAQFVLGYKGYIQLAIRSGNYKKINVIEIKQGELIKFDPLNEEIECILISDYEKREAAVTVGYYAMFEYLNGFRKAVYWSKEKMLAHADQYSPAFSAEAYKKIQNGEIPDDELWKYSSFWYKNFDDMAKKTLLRHIISRWGVMSIEMQSAYEKDASFIEMDSRGNFFASPESEPDEKELDPEEINAEEKQVNLDEL